MNSNQIKILVMVVICGTVIAADQYTKLWADQWLATPAPYANPAHPIRFQVQTAEAGTPFRQLLEQKLPWSEADALDRMVKRDARINGKRAAGAETPVKAGDEILIRRRTVEVFANVWHYKYVRNRGAAFGFLSDMEPTWRRRFFMTVSCLAVVLILMLYRSVEPTQRLLMTSLSLILAGAIGNFIDRVRLDYVIDFIDWHWKEVYHWPTFNIADSAITVGVALLFIEMIFAPPEDIQQEPPEASDAEASAG